MFLNRVLIVFLVLAGVPAYAMLIKAPDTAENGAVIPVDIKLSTPMSAGQRLDLLVNGELAVQVRVVEGKLSAFSTRVKGSKSNTTITARIIANGSAIDSATYNTNVGVTAQASGSPTAVVGVREQKLNGEIKLLMQSENGFAGTLVLQDTGFRAEINGSSVMPKNPFIGVKGEFSENLTATIHGQASLAVKPSPAAKFQLPQVKVSKAPTATASAVPILQNSGVQKSVAIAATNANSQFNKQSYFVLKPGESAKEFKFSKDGSIYFKNKIILKYEYLDVASELHISPPSPMRSYFYAVLWDADKGGLGSVVVDGREGKVIARFTQDRRKPIQVIGEEIRWSPNESYAIFPERGEVQRHVNVIDLKRGNVFPIDIGNLEQNKCQLQHVDNGNGSWLNDETYLFRVGFENMPVEWRESGIKCNENEHYPDYEVEVNARTRRVSSVNKFPSAIQPSTRYPITGTITQHFGVPWSEKPWKTHTGIDIAASAGTFVPSVSAGTVAAIRNLGNEWGYAVVIREAGGSARGYLHVNPTVKESQEVVAGSKIGTVWKNHLHYNVCREVNLCWRGALPTDRKDTENPNDPFFRNGPFVKP